MNLKERFDKYLERLNNGNVPRPPFFKIPGDRAAIRERPAVNIILFLMTLGTTTVAGSTGGESVFDYIINGLPYSLTLMAILLSHEFGHYFAAMRFGIRASLPYFIPFPSLIGTMGAVIKTRTPIPDRRALLYVGVMGPIPGFVVSLAAVIAGVFLSDIKPIPLPLGDEVVPIFGDSLLFAVIVNLVHGSIPAGKDIFLSPYAWAGWIGFLITSLNLMPIGQLDGGHILYALIGNKQRLFGWSAFLGLVVLSFFWYGWIVWVVMTLAFLMIAHPPVPAGEDLSLQEKILGWTGMAILLLTFIPVPVKIL